MDIRSLKIGDIVTTNGIPACSKRGDWYKIVAIDGKDTFTDNKGVEHIGNVSIESVEDKSAYIGGAWANYLEPIPITDELLEKLGFKYTRPNGWWINNKCYNIGILKYEKYYHFSYEGTILDIPISKSIKYLHELKHEMFDAGIELEIKI